MRGWLLCAAALATGCGGAAASPGEPLKGPTAEDLRGEWSSDYVSAGPLYRHTRFHFEEDGTFRLSVESSESFTEPPVHEQYAGTYSLTERSSVSYRWDGGEAESTLALVSGRVLEAPHSCCSRVNGERLWTHLGYLASDPQRTRFRSENWWRSTGAEDSGHGTRVEIAFSTSPLELGPDDDCRVELSVFVETTEPDGTRSRNVELPLPCAVTEHTPGVLVVLIPGYDTEDGYGLLDHPEWSPRTWTRLLADRAPVDAWPERLRELVQRAVRPYLVLDRDRPDVLFTYFDANARVAEGYVSVAR